MSTTLPSLPPRLAAATLAAADNLAAIAAAEAVPLVGKRGEALPHLVTILYTIRERCVQAQAMPEPRPDRLSRRGRLRRCWRRLRR